MVRRTFLSPLKARNMTCGSQNSIIRESPLLVCMACKICIVIDRVKHCWNYSDYCSTSLISSLGHNVQVWFALGSFLVLNGIGQEHVVGCVLSFHSKYPNKLSLWEREREREILHLTDLINKTSCMISLHTIVYCAIEPSFICVSTSSLKVVYVYVCNV